eukprot:5864189-Pleurochrysis_carterae.AAC.1
MLATRRARPSPVHGTPTSLNAGTAGALIGTAIVQNVARLRATAMRKVNALAATRPSLVLTRQPMTSWTRRSAASC